MFRTQLLGHLANYIPIQHRGISNIKVPSWKIGRRFIFLQLLPKPTKLRFHTSPASEYQSPVFKAVTFIAVPRHGFDSFPQPLHDDSSHEQAMKTGIKQRAGTVANGKASKRPISFSGIHSSETI
jgi:hypothetical protein